MLVHGPTIDSGQFLAPLEAIVSLVVSGVTFAFTAVFAVAGVLAIWGNARCRGRRAGKDRVEA